MSGAATKSSLLADKAADSTGIFCRLATAERQSRQHQREVSASKKWLASSASSSIRHALFSCEYLLIGFCAYPQCTMQQFPLYLVATGMHGLYCVCK